MNGMDFVNDPPANELIAAGEFGPEDVANRTEYSVIMHTYGVLSEVYGPFFQDGVYAPFFQEKENRPEFPDLAHKLFVSRSMYPKASWTAKDGTLTITVGLVRLLFLFASRLASGVNTWLSGGMWPKAADRRYRQFPDPKVWLTVSSHDSFPKPIMEYSGIDAASYLLEDEPRLLAAAIEITMAAVEFLVLHESFHAIFRDLDFQKGLRTRGAVRRLAPVVSSVECAADYWALWAMFFLAPRRPIPTWVFEYDTPAFKRRTDRRRLAFVGAALACATLGGVNAALSGKDSWTDTFERSGGYLLPESRFIFASLTVATMNLQAGYHRLWLWPGLFFHPDWRTWARDMVYKTLWAALCIVREGWVAAMSDNPPPWVREEHRRFEQGILTNQEFSDIGKYVGQLLDRRCPSVAADFLQRQR